jgi:hypothetical protein
MIELITHIFREEGDSWVEEAKLERHSDWVCWVLQIYPNIFNSVLLNQSMLLIFFLNAKFSHILCLMSFRFSQLFFMQPLYLTCQLLFLAALWPMGRIVSQSSAPL